MRSDAAGVESSGSATAAAFETFYRAEWSSLVRLAWLMTGSREIAEDLVQDAFLRVEATWATVHSPKAYTRLSVINAVREHGRRRAREARVGFEPGTPVLPPELDETWQLLERLPARQRHALVLRFYADLSFSEIAEALHCRLGTAKSLVHRGLGRLKELMGS